ncbi:hypothetical protein CC78DRAFT_615309 [Lojkania enalia]|uniref:Uncharacterized protein n=1 Tax=Lojkania enalia TaxID=147567 RepID=A0A9P4KHG8_9PLEO|nr:hypothetical protein CC78DRAFT_615309 [Didymosphaeria enalia]
MDRHDGRSTCQRLPLRTRDLTVHIHIFRIVLVLAKLKVPTDYIYFDSSTAGVRIFIMSHDGDCEVCEVANIASEVELEANILLGNIVFYCLNVLKKERIRYKGIDGNYYRDVMEQVEDLEDLVRKERKQSG